MLSKNKSVRERPESHDLIHMSNLKNKSRYRSMDQTVKSQSEGRGGWVGR